MYHLCLLIAAELSATAVGQRVFDVAANSQAALSNFDTFQEAGLHLFVPENLIPTSELVPTLVVLMRSK